MPFNQVFPEYNAYIIGYKNEKPKGLLVPKEYEVYEDSECPASYNPTNINYQFTVTGNDGFQYQAKDKFNNNFHIGITRTSKKRPFSDYNIVIRYNNNNWAYHGKASDLERYIFNEGNSIIEMQNLLASSPFVLRASDNLLFCLFNEKDSFENFKQISNLLSMVFGPKILKFAQLDDVDFYIQSLHLFINCLNCYVTCYGEDTPQFMQFGGIISGDNCRIFKLPPSEEEPPPPPPPEDPSSNGGPTAIYLFQMEIPDPSHSQNPEYCNYIGRFPENLNYNCPSPYIKIANDKVGIICYEGPTITVKVLVRV